MASITFFLFVWLFCKGLKALFKPRRRIKCKPMSETQNNVTQRLAALDALQHQRETIENTIAELTGWLDVSETAAETLRVRNAIAAQYGKLATVEKNIKKITG